MALTHRPMAPGDVRECVEIIAKHPMIGPRYGSAIADLRAAWLKLLNCQARTATVLKPDDRPHAPICFVGVSVIVTDDFVREMKTAPLFWIGPELARRIVRGNSPLLTDKQLREDNSRGGLNLLVWEGCLSSQFERDTEIARYVINLFIEEHSGFLWKELIADQADTGERLRLMLQSGSLLWNPQKHRYVQGFEGDPDEIVRKPHLVGLTRQIETERTNSWTDSWVGGLFDYQPPKCSFTRGEQRMLSKALEGWTDEELSEKLATSLPTVKKTWRSIYHRAGAKMPGLNPDEPEMNAIETKRGREKKRRLLTYLRNHPEELRPFAKGPTGR
jgi:hypothetical protein